MDTNTSRRRVLNGDVVEEETSRPAQRRRYDTVVEPELEEDPVINYPVVDSVPVRITGGTKESAPMADESSIYTTMRRRRRWKELGTERTRMRETIQDKG